MSENMHRENLEVVTVSEENHGLGMDELMEAAQMNPEDQTQLDSIRERVQNASKAMRAAIVE